MIVGFWQTKEVNGYLSNWYKAEFNFDGHHFYNSEQAFMYLKAKLFNDVEMIKKILNTKNPASCKKFGRAVKQFDSIVFDKYKYRTEDENEKLKNLEKSLRERVIGQNEAVEAVAKAIRRGTVIGPVVTPLASKAMPK